MQFSALSAAAFSVVKGKTVRVTVKGGIVFEGVFHTANTQAKSEAEFGIVLAFARKIEDPGSKKKDRTITNMLVISAADFVEVEARDLPMATGKSGALGGFTDTEISGSKVKHGEARELTKWDGGEENISLSLDAPGTEWDQFATNEEKFGVTTTYNERMYTTDLNKSTLTPAQIAHAEKMAREIEGDTSMNDNIHVREDRGQETEKDAAMDEEDRHSSVLTKNLSQRHDKDAKKDGAGVKKAFKMSATAKSFNFNPGATAFTPGKLPAQQMTPMNPMYAQPNPYLPGAIAGQNFGGPQMGFQGGMAPGGYAGGPGVRPMGMAPGAYPGGMQQAAYGMAPGMAQAQMMGGARPGMPPQMGYAQMAPGMGMPPGGMMPQQMPQQPAAPSPAPQGQG